MFLRLDPAFSLAGAHATPHRRWLECLLAAHRLGNLIAVLSREQIVAFGASAGLSDDAHSTLSFISSRLNDYEAAEQLTRRVIVARPNALEANYSLHGRELRMAIRLLTRERLLHRTFFIAENLSDIRLLEVLVDSFLKTQNYPSTYIKYRSVLGGGNTVADVIAGEDTHPPKGIVLCDRDICDDVPPFGAGTTGARAFEKCKELGLLEDVLGWSDISPLFCFLSTWGRTVENFIGPNVSNLYLSANNRRQELREFLNAFPRFPNLSAIETDIWRYINLKDRTPNWPPVSAKLRQLHGPPPGPILTRVKYYRKLQLPRDAIDWVVANAIGTQWSRRLQTSMSADFSIQPYREGIELLTQHLREVAAGDRAAATL